MGGSPSTNGRPDLAGLLDRLGHEAVKVRELIAEAHGVIRDLTHHTREAKRVAKVAVEEEVAAEIKRQMDEFGDMLSKGRDEAMDKVLASFDDLSAILLGFEYHRKHPDVPALPDFVHRVTAQICPGCGEAVETFTSITEPDHKPEIGSIAICWYCSAIAVYDNRYTLRLAAAAEVELAMQNPLVRKFFTEKPNDAPESMRKDRVRSWLDRQAAAGHD